jgi:hypothetical protein
MLDFALSPAILVSVGIWVLLIALPVISLVSATSYDLRAWSLIGESKPFWVAALTLTLVFSFIPLFPLVYLLRIRTLLRGAEARLHRTAPDTRIAESQ